VNLTWDETDPRRNELVNKLKTNPKTEVDDSDLQKYVAFSSENEDSDNENKSSGNEIDEDIGTKKNPIDKYKELLQNIQEEEERKTNKETELEISWGIGAQEKMKKTISEKSMKNLTPFQKMMEKKKERMREKQQLKKETKYDKSDSDSENDQNKQAELELLLMDEEHDGKQHFNIKTIQENYIKTSKKKNKKQMKNEKSDTDDFKVSY